MGKTAKISIGVIVALIVAVVIASALLLRNLDDIIKRVIEDVGSQVTQTEVRAGTVKFTLQEGRGEIGSLTVANPAGYESPHAFRMDQVAVEIDPASLTGPVVVIREILVDGATLVAEQKGLQTNLKELLDNIRSKSGTPAEPPPAEEGASDVRLMLEKFAFINTSATLKTQQWGDQSLQIPDVRLADFGDRETGLTPGELAGRMTQALVKQVERAVSEKIEDLAKDAAKKELNKQIDKNLSDKDKARLEGLKSMFKRD